MRTIILKSPYSDGFKSEKDKVAVAYLKELTAVYDAMEAGTLYCKYLDGDRKGSIARVKHDPSYSKHRPKIDYKRYGRNDDRKYDFHHDYFTGICTWDGRKNKVKVCFPISYEPLELLLDYEGPTVWEKFDAKAAKEQVLKNPDQRDIDGNVLSIGDSVLFINARYGARMTLTRGKIKEFNVVANSKSTTVTTIIESDDGARSELAYPEDMVYRL